MSFENKVVWITGASSGIGRATALAFAKEKARLVISSNMEDELKEVAEECRQMGAECEAIPFDLLKQEQIDQAFETVKMKFGAIDILFNNGGISQRSKAIETPMELDRKIMEINFFGGLALTKKVLPLMLEKGAGHIAVTSSISGKFGFHLRSAYAASKHAIQGYYETLGIELKPENIRVTIIVPGRVKTNISLHALTKEGVAHGKMDEGQNSGISPESCARKILKAIRKNKREVLVGGSENLMVYIKRLSPKLFYRIVSKIKPT